MTVIGKKREGEKAMEMIVCTGAVDMRSRL
jgi:hypothetical protein